MNVVDSSSWLEYFGNGENADFFAAIIEDTENLLVPTICLYEVFKRILQQRNINAARTNVSDMYEGCLIDLTAPIALSAAQIYVEYKLPMADSLILATARLYDATLWTQDEHFRDIPGVKFIAKK